MKYDFYVSLNEEGMKLWGDVFPDGNVPTRGMSTGETKDARDDKKLEVYMVDWTQLTDAEKKGVVDKLSEKFKASREDVQMEILKRGLPIQTKYVSASIGSLRYFI